MDNLDIQTGGVMKIIFLDFDGVLNEWYSNNRIKDLKKRIDIQRKLQSNMKTKLEGHCEKNYLDTIRSSFEFDIDKVRVLSRVVDKTGAKVVITSSWRFETSLDIALSLRGFEYPENIIGITPTGKDRGHEIKQFLEEFQRNNPNTPIEDFIILDDDMFDIEYMYPNNSISTRPLTKCIGDIVIKRFNKKK